MTSSEQSPRPPRTFWDYMKDGFVHAHRRRPRSFYLMLLIPVVLLLGAHMGQFREIPHRFALLLSLMLVFFWLIIAWALNDFFALCRKYRAEKRALWRETIGDYEFASTLGAQVRRKHRRAP